MTQQNQFYLLIILLLCLLLKPLYMYPQRRHPPYGMYYNQHVPMENPPNFVYRPYQPHYASSQFHQLPFQRRSDIEYREENLEDSQNMEYKIQQRSIQTETTQATLLPIPYQGKTENTDDPMDLKEKIRSIFVVGEEDLKLFNSTVNPNFSKLSNMHGDASLIHNNKNATDQSSHQSSDTIRTTGLTSQSSMYTPISPSSSSSSSSLASSSLLTSSTVNGDEPSFKVQRTPEGKLSLVFNDKLSLQNLTTTRKSKPPNVIVREEIIFPGSQAYPSTTFKGCEDDKYATICKKVRNYPDLSKIDSRGLSDLSLFVTEDVEEPINISQRSGSEPIYTDLCRSEINYTYPEGGETIDSGWLYIVQNTNSLQQRVRVETCSGENEPCDYIKDNLPIQYQSVCIQSFVYRALVAIHNGTYVKRQFKIPSCCKCVLKTS